MQRQPAEVWPVGKFIQDELDARGWSRLRLAHRMSGARDTNLATIDLLIFAPTPGLLLGEETAQDLSQALGSSPQFWLNLDEAWQAHQNEIQAGHDASPRDQGGLLDSGLPGHDTGMAATTPDR